MKSDVIHVTNTGAGVAEAVKQTELVANFKSLSKTDAIHLLLLTEEMMGMMKALTGKQEADFWIEDDNDTTFRLHLKAETEMNTEMRQKLLSASTSGENIAAKGVMGKLRDSFNRLVEPSEAPMSDEYSSGWVSENLSTAQAAAVAKNYTTSYVNVWSLNRYRANQQSGEEWDELEKSIIANIADEVEIGIAEGTVEMIVYKKV